MDKKLGGLANTSRTLAIMSTLFAGFWLAENSYYVQCQSPNNALFHFLLLYRLTHVIDMVTTCTSIMMSGSKAKATNHSFTGNLILQAPFSLYLSSFGGTVKCE